MNGEYGKPSLNGFKEKWRQENKNFNLPSLGFPSPSSPVILKCMSTSGEIQSTEKAFPFTRLHSYFKAPSTLLDQKFGKTSSTHTKTQQLFIVHTA